MPNNFLSLKPAVVLCRIQITLTINYFSYETWGDDVISHVTLLRSSFLLTMTKIMTMIFFNNDTSMGQRKILSPRRESNPWPPRYQLGRPVSGRPWVRFPSGTQNFSLSHARVIVEKDHRHYLSPSLKFTIFIIYYDENSLLLKKQSMQLEAHWREEFLTAQEPNKI